MNLEADLSTEKYFVRAFTQKLSKEVSEKEKCLNDNSQTQSEGQAIFNSLLSEFKKRFYFKILLSYGIFKKSDEYFSFLEQISKKSISILDVYRSLFNNIASNVQILSNLTIGNEKFNGPIFCLNSEFFLTTDLENEILNRLSSDNINIQAGINDFLSAIKEFGKDNFRTHYFSLIGYVYQKWLIKDGSGSLGSNRSDGPNEKIRGIAYTPKPIAQLMANQALDRLLKYRFNFNFNRINEMDILEITSVLSFLMELTVCDNSCGCGIFLLTFIETLMKFLTKLGEPVNKNLKTAQNSKIINSEITKNNLLMHVLRKNIYGVDCDKDSVNITRFLLASKLILNWSENDNLSNDFWDEIVEKIHDHICVGDTMIGFPVPKAQQTTLDKYCYDSLQTLNKHFLLKVAEQRLNNRSAKINKAEFEALLSSEEKQKKIENMNLFHWTSHFRDVFQSGGFDLIIGNPPYVRQELLKQDTGILNLQLKDLYAEVIKGTLNSDLTMARTSDLSILFLIRSIQLINPRGLVSFIMTDKWIQRNYGKVYRDFILKHCHIHDLIDLTAFSIFSEVSADPVIIQIGIKQQQPKHSEKSTDIRYYKPEKLTEFIYSPVLIPTKNFSSEKWSFNASPIYEIKSIVEKVGKPISQTDLVIRFGIKTGFNDAFIIDSETKEKMVSKCPNAVKILKPVLRGRNIFPFKITDPKMWMITIPKGFTVSEFRETYINDFNIRQDIPSTDPLEFVIDLTDPQVSKYFENKFIENYQIVHQHLLSFEHSTSRGKGLKSRDDLGDFWWELRSCNYYEEFEKPKIIWQEITKTPSFYYDTAGYYGLAKTYIMNSPQPKVHLLIFNSTLSKSLISWYGTNMKDVFEFKKRYVEKFPIVFAPENEIRYYDLICDILHYLAPYNGLSNYFDFFYRISDMLVFRIYFNNESIDSTFKLDIEEKVAELFSIFNDFLDISDDIAKFTLAHNTIKKEFDSITKKITQFHDILINFNARTQILNNFENWSVFKQLSER